MDNVPLIENVNSLKKLAEEYERQLNLLGLELFDLPEDCRILIDKCIEVQSETNLSDMDITYLGEYYYNQKQEYIENYIKATKLNMEIEKLKQSIKSEEESIKTLEKFSADVSKQIVSEVEMERKKIEIDKNIFGLSNIQQGMAAPTDICIDELLQQIESYEKRNKSKNS